MISAEQVKELREMTGAGMMECKKVLEETEGNMEKATELLRERGVVKAAKKAGRIAAEGLVDSYIHGDGRIGVLVEVNIETDFAAKNPEFREFVKDVAMQIAAILPVNQSGMRSAWEHLPPYQRQRIFTPQINPEADRMRRMQ